MDSALRHANTAGVRDVAVQKLRDLTIAVAIAAAAGVGVIGWLSAATIPGATGTSSVTGNVSTGDDEQPFSTSDDGFAQTQPGKAQFGSGVAVSGGSH